MPEDLPAKFSIRLPSWYDRKLRIWAAIKGTKRATLSANILQARIAANWDELEKELEAIAKLQGITKEETIERLLNGGSEDDDI